MKNMNRVSFLRLFTGAVGVGAMLVTGLCTEYRQRSGTCNGYTDQVDPSLLANFGEADTLQILARSVSGLFFSFLENKGLVVRSRCHTLAWEGFIR